MGKWQYKKLWTRQISLRSPYISPKCWRPSTNFETTQKLAREEFLAYRRGNEQNKKLFSGENTSKKPVRHFVEPLQHHLRPSEMDWNCLGSYHWWHFNQYKKLWTGQISLRSPYISPKCWRPSTNFETTRKLAREEFLACRRGNEQNKKLYSGENTSKKPVRHLVEPFQHHLRPSEMDWNCLVRYQRWRFNQYKKVWTWQIPLRSPSSVQQNFRTLEIWSGVVVLLYWGECGPSKKLFFGKITIRSLGLGHQGSSRLRFGLSGLIATQNWH